MTFFSNRSSFKFKRGEQKAECVMYTSKYSTIIMQLISTKRAKIYIYPNQASFNQSLLIFVPQFTFLQLDWPVDS